MGIVRFNLTDDSSFIGMHGHLGSSLCLCLYSVYIFHQSCDSTGTWNAVANRCMCCNLPLVLCPTPHYLQGNLLERGTQCHLDYIAYGICDDASGVDAIVYSNGLECGLQWTHLCWGIWFHNHRSQRLGDGIFKSLM
jgi:hypothetical protein